MPFSPLKVFNFLSFQAVQGSPWPGLYHDGHACNKWQLKYRKTMQQARYAVSCFNTNSKSLLEIDDVSAHLVQEGAEVGGANDGSRERLQPIFQPLDVVHVQVTSGFIQHQHIGVHQLGSTSKFKDYCMYLFGTCSLRRYNTFHLRTVETNAAMLHSCIFIFQPPE